MALDPVIWASNRWSFVTS